MKRWVLIAIGLLFQILPIKSQHFPGVEWAVNNNFAEEGWKMDALEEAYEFLVDSTSITGLVIIQNGKMIIDYGNISENSYIASCRKSITAMLYGPHVTSGKIQLDKSLKDLGIDDHGGLLTTEKRATIEDVIAARSGVFHNGSNRGDFLRYAPDRGSVQPGSYWLYNNWDFNMAQFILEQETGTSLYQEIENTLAIPLQMEDWDIDIQRTGGDTSISKYPARHILFSTRDMARIGLLMLGKGKWKNAQVLSEEWVGEMTSRLTTHSEINENVPIFRNSGFDFGYGYMWWLWEMVEHPNLKGAYSALGSLGQSITVFPAIDVVIAYKTNDLYDRATPMFKGLTLLKMLALSYE